MDSQKDVYPVVRLALVFFRRLEANQRVSLEAVQSELRGMLQVGPSQRVGTDPRNPFASAYLGGPAALVYWLDELFSNYSTWADDWENRKLEQHFFGTSVRAHEFWEQAKLAVGRADRPALEVFYLALLLGFRGELRDRPPDLEQWRKTFEGHLKPKGSEWPEMPPSLPMDPTCVPPLTAKPRLRTFLIAVALVGTSAIGVATFFLSKAWAS